VSGGHSGKRKRGSRRRENPESSATHGDGEARRGGTVGRANDDSEARNKAWGLGFIDGEHELELDASSDLAGNIVEVEGGGDNPASKHACDVGTGSSADGLHRRAQRAEEQVGARVGQSVDGGLARNDDGGSKDVDVVDLFRRDGVNHREGRHSNR
jgi:hypothetical protein